MIGYSVGFDRSVALDQDAILDASRKTDRQNLQRFGSFVMTRARQSFGTEHRPSRTGLAPTSHTGAVKNFIRFASDNNWQSVVIGPERLHKIGDAPAALEDGGASIILDRGRRVPAQISAHPFMKPAFDVELSRLPLLWAGSLRRRS